MGVLLGLLWPLRRLNDLVLPAGMALGVAAVAAMVVAILIQVFFRYVLGNALAWPDEFSRFMMLWMTGLMAPTAFRRGGFVAIEMVAAVLPRALAGALALALLVLSLVVLLYAFRIGAGEVCGIGGRFDTVSLWVPDLGLRVDLRAVCALSPAGAVGWTLPEGGLGTLVKVPRWWTMLSIHVGVVLMMLVNIELILRALIGLAGGGDRLPAIRGTDMAGAE
ncbi:MAG: TRAP transporter small permease subunit [Rhodobacteraceae bacterium]|jgi:TRAP-type C4-dicarboxylate transport system permease small subunit|nr:TRAP transporter small permease subunit [Paracoccaceae bacterium]